MCGLIGIAGPAADALTPENAEAFVGQVAHRGPDGWGLAAGDGWRLGHTRLAIQDLTAAGSQPFVVEDLTLTFNGEIWNANALEVGQRETSSDTEVVAKLLQRHGEHALEDLDGMWALAWHDGQELRLARDRYGKVPLYYATDGASLYWASEYQALPQSLRGAPVPPGHVLAVDTATGSARAYPWATEEQLAIGPPATPETVRALLRKGVAERLVGDRSIAFMLSGGLDSSLILALAREHYSGSELVAYTAVLDPESRDLAAARWVAEHFGVPLVEVPVPVPTEETIAAAVAAVEIPMKAQVEIALAHLPVMEQIAADGHAVCLSGEAADELFGGYGGMQIKAAKADDDGYREIKRAAVEKMSRGNFSRVNKVGMAYGVECRLPFMQSDLVALALEATKADSPPGKKLLKAAASGLVPDRIIRRPKETFQGSVGTASAAASFGGVAHYNALARNRFGYLPKE